MDTPKIRELTPGYSAEVDTVSEDQWCEILREFDDANIYQTWPYARVTRGARNVSHLVLKKDGQIIAAAQARLAKLPFLGVGIAYIMWGPLWRRRGSEECPEALRQAIRALRNEFACRRGLVLRVFPTLFSDDPPSLAAILAEEGFSLSEKRARRTILLDLAPSLEDLRGGMKTSAKKELKRVERRDLEIVSGTEDGLFEKFIGIYKEMVARKKFVEPNDINEFRLMQAQLPDALKMKILLCRSGDTLCSGIVYSAIGKKAIYLFGATSAAGRKVGCSFLLQWRLMESLKGDGFSTYDLNGINPVTNPGTYKFKDDLAGANGRDVMFLGRFDSYGSTLSYCVIKCAETLRTAYRKFGKLIKTAGNIQLWPKRPAGATKQALAEKSAGRS